MSQASAPVRHSDRFYIGGQWVAPSSGAKISVIDSDTEQLYFTVPEAQAADISRAIDAARDAFDIAQEEIFGPVLSVIPADDEQDAVRIANDTIYGLNASVFTNDVNRARDTPAQPQTLNGRFRHFRHCLADASTFRIYRA